MYQYVLGSGDGIWFLLLIRMAVVLVAAQPCLGKTNEAFSAYF